MLRRSHCTIQFAAAALLVCGALAAHGGMFGKDSPVPQWGLDAAKTSTPSYAGDAPSVILYDEYVESVDDQGRAVEREREAIRILKPQARNEGCETSYDVDEKINYFRVWTIGADEKVYQAKDADFVDVGDTSDSKMLSTRKSAHRASTRCGCGRHDRLRVRRANGAMEAGKDLGDSERGSRRI